MVADIVDLEGSAAGTIFIATKERMYMIKRIFAYTHHIWYADTSDPAWGKTLIIKRATYILRLSKILAKDLRD